MRETNKENVDGGGTTDECQQTHVQHEEDADRDTKIGLMQDDAQETKKESDSISKYEERNGRNYRIVCTTIALYLSYIGLGACVAILGLSVVDLQYKLQASLQKITYIFPARSCGFVLGSIVGGVCLDKFDNMLVMGSCLLGLTFTGSAIGWCDGFALVLVFIAMWGFFLGVLETGGNFVCVRIWAEKSEPMIQGLYFFFAVGATAIPLISNPFLSPLNVPSANNISACVTPAPTLAHIENLTVLPHENPQEKRLVRDTFYSSLFGETSLLEYLEQEAKGGIFNPQVEQGSNDNVRIRKAREKSVDEDEDEFSAGQFEMTPLSINCDEVAANKTPAIPFIGKGMLWVPYTILSTLFILTSGLFFWLFMQGSRQLIIRRTVNNSDGAQDPPPTNESGIFKMTLLVLLFFFSFAYIGHEVTFGGFIYIFAMESSFGFNVPKATYLTSAFWGSYALARGLGVFCAARLTPRVMLVIDCIGLCSASILLSIFADEVEAVLWGASILLGLSMGTVFAAGISWGDRYIKLTGKAMSSFVVAAAAADGFFPFLFGVLQRSYGMMVLMYMVLAMSLSVTLAFIVMQTIASCHGEERDRRDVVVHIPPNANEMSTLDNP